MKNKYRLGWKWNLSTSEVANELRCSTRSIQRRAKDGEIPFRLIGGRRRFCLEEVWECIGKTSIRSSSSKLVPILRGYEPLAIHTKLNEDIFTALNPDGKQKAREIDNESKENA